LPPRYYAAVTDDELKRLFAEFQRENAAMHAETRRENAAKLAETRQENAAMHAETRRHFEILTEATRHEIRLVAEAVIQVDEKLDREAADIRSEMRRGFAETQAMIKFSHVELDRRMRTLEDAVTDLQARVERLESTTH
jgi:hypothetical protein